MRREEVLRLIRAECAPGVPIRERTIAARLGVNAAYLSVILCRLVDAGEIRIAQGVYDRRENFVHLISNSIDTTTRAFVGAEAPPSNSCDFRRRQNRSGSQPPRVLRWVRRRCEEEGWRLLEKETVDGGYLLTVMDGLTLKTFCAGSTPAVAAKGLAREILPDKGQR